MLSLSSLLFELFCPSASLHLLPYFLSYSRATCCIASLPLFRFCCLCVSHSLLCGQGCAGGVQANVERGSEDKGLGKQGKGKRRQTKETERKDSPQPLTTSGNNHDSAKAYTQTLQKGERKNRKQTEPIPVLAKYKSIFPKMYSTSESVCAAELEMYNTSESVCTAKHFCSGKANRSPISRFEHLGHRRCAAKI